MTPRLEFFYDYASRYSYLADSQLPALARRAEAEIVYRPAICPSISSAGPAATGSSSHPTRTSP